MQRCEVSLRGEVGRHKHISDRCLLCWEILPLNEILGSKLVVSRIRRVAPRRQGRISLHGETGVKMSVAGVEELRKSRLARFLFGPILRLLRRFAPALFLFTPALFFEKQLLAIGRLFGRGYNSRMSRFVR